MPHSSGGGSSGGGSHRGSGRSGGKSNPKFGSQYYAGSHRYVYYVNRRPRYYFSDTPYTLKDAKERKKSGISGGILWTIISSFFFFTIAGAIHFPQKVPIDYETGIVIEDNIDVLTGNEEAEMEEAFSRFRDDTGITPSFLAVSDSGWREQADTLEIYAYRSYINLFDDEKHWLVVYASEGDRESWSWEGMIGDDCGGMITEDLEDQFTEEVQKNLWDSSRYTVKDAVCQAFEDIDRKAQKVQFELEDILLLLGILAAIGYGIYKIIGSIRMRPEEDPMLEASRCGLDQEKPAEDTCRYCGGVYVHGAHETCPHCGAPAEVDFYG